MTLQELRNDIKHLSDPVRATFVAGYFKTGKGQYGEGDIFVGLTVPQARNIAKTYKDLAGHDIERLLESTVHEERQIGLMILRHQFDRADSHHRAASIALYLQHLRAVNNWDLVDGSAEMLGEWLHETHAVHRLYDFAKSEQIWERRIAIIATYYWIKSGDPEPTLRIAQMLLADNHDLIHKAVGWMLREVGKRISQRKEEEFLQKHYTRMPRTMLRYAIERFPQSLRKAYLEGTVLVT